MQNYPGEYITCVLVCRSDGSNIWWPALDYRSNPPVGSYEFTHVLKPRRPEVTRQYNTVPVARGVAHSGQFTHYRLEEIP